MDKPFLPYDRDDSPEPETPVDVSKNPPPQTSKVLRQPDGTEVETPTDSTTPKKKGKVLKGKVL